MHFPTDDGLVKSVDGVSFAVEQRPDPGIVGESGSGKSVTMQAVMGLHRRTRAKMSGEIVARRHGAARGQRRDGLRQLRGDTMAMIFQDPLSALHPFYTVGNQISEAYRVHNKASKTRRSGARAIEMLRPRRHPQRRRAACDQYPA